MSETYIVLHQRQRAVLRMYVKICRKRVLHNRPKLISPTYIRYIRTVAKRRPTRR